MPRPRTLPAPKLCDDRAPWMRQPHLDRSPERWDAFLAYRDQVIPSISALAVQLGRPLSTLLNWSSQGLWPARRHAYQDDVRAEHLRSAAVLRGELALKHTGALESILDKLTDYANDLDFSDVTSDKTLASLAKLMETADKLLGGADGRGAGTTVNVAVQVNNGPSAEAQLAAILRACESRPELRDVVQGIVIA